MTTVVLDDLTNSQRPNFETDFENLFLCGDWTNTGLPATIESAAISSSEIIKKIINN